MPDGIKPFGFGLVDMGIPIHLSTAKFSPKPAGTTNRKQNIPIL